ncbi:hypothetical protein F511_26130 [Dorcoceras hygrometricum]|uniref:DUF7356 domain-containing protein n=1 Tax=Dorcoceras hygrometricum TaxID=472368 RepID=A0A2Z7CNL5_9LAMI|nr:hypothetical protein F511_26130 [Dorcoceras hygrometricum]
MRILEVALAVIYLTCVVVPCHSDGSFLYFFRKLEQDADESKLNAQVSPSPSPVPVENRDSGNAQSPMNSPKKETCDLVADKCRVMESHVSACVPFDGNVSRANYLLVMNEGESSHRVSITIFPANISVEDNTDIPGHQSKKVKLPSTMGSGYSSILLSSENGNCTIHLGVSLPKSFYMNYVTPVNGTYLFFVTAFFLGGTLICCKFSRKGRHLSGVKYKELEMGEQQPNSTFTIETREDWDEEWGDDDWDEQKR